VKEWFDCGECEIKENLYANKSVAISDARFYYLGIDAWDDKLVIY